ncbi:hypothetical protein GQX73_g6769 [Xylaria multiplex]|uniref:DUF6923 domain-containing protein n=1 Tax=Xylaria multiplex TaxID=323545 RepID=A0A7C8IPG1_9PEZI|nr:hypothetical protein GQX73_g6769 [Xylaria multiplex]
MIQNNELYRVNFTSSLTTLIGNDVGTSIDAIGYNTLDNYLYASDLVFDTAFLIKIGGTGAFTPVAELPLGPDGQNWNNGDFDENGHYWASYDGEAWIEVDVVPDSVTYGRVISSGIADPLDNKPMDWAYVPGGSSDYLWALGSSASYDRTQLMFFDRVTHTWSLATDFGNVAGRNTWSAIYAGPNQSIIASEDVSGEVWSFPLPNTDGEATPLSKGPAAGNNHGARCLHAI